MNKEQLIQAIVHNAQATLSFAKDSNDSQLEVIAHATLMAVVATQQGHGEELLTLLASFVAFQIAKDEEQKEKVQNELEEILKSSGIEVPN